MIIEELIINTSFLKDASKPEGEACNPDGSLKDADTMEWLNSPSDLAPATSFENHDKDVPHVLDDETDTEHVKKRRRVSQSSNPIDIITYIIIHSSYAKRVMQMQPIWATTK